MQATAQDAPALADLERRCHSHPWTIAHFERSIGGGPGGRRVLVLRGSDHPLGGILAYCAVESVLDEAHIHNLAVRPDLRRRRLGLWLLRQTLDILARQGTRSFLLEVRASNQPALALYGGLGFGEVGRRPGYYRDPLEDAIVLQFGLAPPPAKEP